MIEAILELIFALFKFVGYCLAFIVIIALGVLLLPLCVLALPFVAVCLILKAIFD